MLVNLVPLQVWESVPTAMLARFLARVFRYVISVVLEPSHLREVVSVLVASAELMLH